MPREANRALPDLVGDKSLRRLPPGDPLAALEPSRRGARSWTRVRTPLALVAVRGQPSRTTLGGPTGRTLRCRMHDSEFRVFTSLDRGREVAALLLSSSQKQSVVASTLGANRHHPSGQSSIASRQQPETASDAALLSASRRSSSLASGPLATQIQKR